MTRRARSSVRVASWLLVAGIGVVAMPAACLYPAYTFDEPEPSGSGGSGGQGGQGGEGGDGMGGQGGVPGAEDCLNGTDDDGDTLVDCADDDCTPGFSCVPEAPVGWEGFAALFEGAEAQEPSCSGAFASNTYTGNHTLLTPPHTCSACTCGSPTGQTCTLPTTITLSDKPCGQVAGISNPFNPPQNWTGACSAQSGYALEQVCGGAPCNPSVSAPKPTIVGGSCDPAGGVANKPLESWAFLGKACINAPKGGGCGAGEVCQPRAPLPFLGEVCVFKGGDNSCPAGQYADKHLFYEDVEDSRACTTCTCGSPTGSSCDATIQVSSDTGCNSELASFTAGQCANLPNNFATILGRKAAITNPPSGGACAVSGGGQATGAITPDNATTFCCRIL
ncbi:hypothetical protein [Polyangium sorediatum]|uniref:Lipoprotein n=1 Tax=Polyangium sorediatum TaxID=889274 RepID=A0ABT6NPV1_9BACT|nr:hypothetical protein [Polyangium sorediatum]MDI1430349.1 hypothetical protein [Polyangium sorediatum]